MSDHTRCPECGFVRPAGEEDSPTFHKRTCLARRALQRKANKTAKASAFNYRGIETRTIGEATVKVTDDGGYIMAAISFDGLRWMAAR
jgi:hypothetical protein